MEEISREKKKQKHLKDMTNLTVYQNPEPLLLDKIFKSPSAEPSELRSKGEEHLYSPAGEE